MALLQGRSSASGLTITTLVVLISFLQLISTIEAGTFTVGDTSGWSFGTNYNQAWVGGKKFKAGDMLVFNYDPSMHNVVIVDGSGYNSCSASPGSKTYSTGNDRIKLKKGENYFICSIPGHCDGGLKISVTAS